MPMIKEISQIAYVLPANGEEIRNRYLYEIFTQVNKIVKKKENKQRKLYKEAQKL